jgi:hypothetical protein
MTRDMDLIRELLIGIEKDARLDGVYYMMPNAKDNLGVIGQGKYSDPEIAYNLALLIQANLVKGKTLNEEMPAICGLTWTGHEFLDNIRDAGIWGKTKERLKGIPSAALGVVVAVAEAEIKKRLGLH